MELKHYFVRENRSKMSTAIYWDVVTKGLVQRTVRRYPAPEEAYAMAIKLDAVINKIQ